VDKKKVGHLALAIQVAFQELGVFPASNTQVPLDTKEPMPFSTVQAVETAQRVAALGRIVSRSTGSLSGKEEDGDLDSLRRELQHALAPEISRKEVALRTVPDGLVISLREVGFFESASADIKSSSQPALAGSYRCSRSATIAFASRAIPIMFRFTILVLTPIGNCPRLGPHNWFAC